MPKKKPTAAPTPPAAPPANKGLVGLLAFLSVVLVGLIVVGVVAGHSLMPGLGPAITVMIVAAFSLLTAAVLSKALDATGVWKTKGTQLGGAAAIFAATFSLLSVAMVKLPQGNDLPPRPDADSVKPRIAAPSLTGQVLDLPPGTSDAQVFFTGCSASKASVQPGDGTFNLPGCDLPGTPEYLFNVEVKGFRSEPIPVPKGQAIYTLRFKGTPEGGFELSGYILQANKRPADGARVYVEREGCVDFRADTDGSGHFVLRNLPPRCLTPPHSLTVIFEKQAPETFDAADQSSDIRHTLTAGAPAAPGHGGDPGGHLALKHALEERDQAVAGKGDRCAHLDRAALFITQARHDPQSAADKKLADLDREVRSLRGNFLCP